MRPAPARSGQIQHSVAWMRRRVLDDPPPRRLSRRSTESFELSSSQAVRLFELRRRGPIGPAAAAAAKPAVPFGSGHCAATVLLECCDGFVSFGVGADCSAAI